MGRTMVVRLIGLWIALLAISCWLESRFRIPLEVGLAFLVAIAIVAVVTYVFAKEFVSEVITQRIRRRE